MPGVICGNYFCCMSIALNGCYAGVGRNKPELSLLFLNGQKNTENLAFQKYVRKVNLS